MAKHCSLPSRTQEFRLTHYSVHTGWQQLQKACAFGHLCRWKIKVKPLQNVVPYCLQWVILEIILLILTANVV